LTTTDGFPDEFEGKLLEAGLQRSIQGLILAFFSFDLLLTVYNSLSYFLPIISAISSAGVVPVFNVQVSLLKGLLQWSCWVWLSRMSSPTGRI